MTLWLTVAVLAGTALLIMGACVYVVLRLLNRGLLGKQGARRDQAAWLNDRADSDQVGARHPGR